MKAYYNEAAKDIIQRGLAQLNSVDFTQRLYKHDATLWKSEKEHTDIINNSLGWTEVYDWAFTKIPEVKNFADEAKKLFDHIVLMGMGGSSLAPEVLRTLFGRQFGWPELLVLDSTNPDWVSKVRKQIDPLKTLFIFASKSGSTVEPASQFAYFYDEVAKAGATEPGKNFIAITDPSTGLEALAKEKGFRKIFLNKADIGGRFSALSFFGLVPAALCGIDIEKLLKAAKEEGDNFKNELDNSALSLGALMGKAYIGGQDKLTLVMSKNISNFGLWIEQLVAESTGKEGKGVVPVATEAAHKNFAYGQDRIFVAITLEGQEDNDIVELTETLQASAQPFAQFFMKDLYDIGAQFLFWEIATAASGAIMQIDPFDQPNVQAAKTIAKALLADLEAGKKSPLTEAAILVSKNLEGKVNLPSLLKDIEKLPQGKDYVAVLAYLNATDKTDNIFAKIKDTILTASKHAVLFGYGPRYLHSTGQLHKGDGNNGIFLIISADPKEDVKIPGQAYSFAGLVNAQALADFKALEEKGRRVIKIHVKQPVEDALEKLLS
ncbi:MAG: glucose-6-phosphate isomerase [Elusimicrobiota bacterium]|jgi:glucose-6-phosphate isomerase/transaldolase/glucose-6-phosphate isomerase|nr:glucose-6-phosphate isomerase [Elusimicrobiota bacterium]